MDNSCREWEASYSFSNIICPYCDRKFIDTPRVTIAYDTDGTKAHNKCLDLVYELKRNKKEQLDIEWELFLMKYKDKT